MMIENKKDTNKKFRVSFPHLGNYSYPIYNMLEKLVDKDTTDILVAPKMSTKTIELGAISSPDFVCLPFKYNMGNFIEALNNGANFLIQAGGGCRYGYYGEVQEQILKDMGYEFTYINLLDPDGVDVLAVYNRFKVLNHKLKFASFVYIFLTAIKSIAFLDEVETYIRDNYVYEKNKGEFDKIHKELLDRLLYISNINELVKYRKGYLKRLKNIKLESNKERYIKIGIVGELYTSMEPFSTFFLEKELANFNIAVKRYTTVTYLLFKKSRAQKGLIKSASKYIEYPLGADGTESVAHTLELIENGFDGIIHIKPFGCTPEINAMPILQKISNEYDIPIMYLTFDSQTSRTGIKTRIEAFYDMLKMKREQAEMDNEILKEEKRDNKKYVKALKKSEYRFQN